MDFKTIIRAILAGVLVVAFLVVLALLYFRAIPDANKEYYSLALGALIVLVKDATHWYYGSTQGSSDKTDILNSTK